MRRLRPALILAAAVAVVLLVGMRAASSAEARDVPLAETAPVVLQSANIAQRPLLFATVVRPFGATVRVLPATDATALFNAPCGEILPVLSVDRGWVKVQTENGAGWIGGSRVHVSSTPPVVDCSEARFISPTSSAATTVSDGCLDLRSRPGDDAPILSCVESGHLYAVIDGPFDPGSGDDWFRVSSPGTGSGWALAEHLYPS
jgi:hypothetical protein